MEEKFYFIRERINELPKKKMGEKEQDFVRRYLGTEKKVLGVKTADLERIAKAVLKETGDVREIIGLIERLIDAETFEEYVVGGKIFTLLKLEQRAQIPLEKLGQWLFKARGWIEVDVFCQSSFAGNEVLQRWPEWEKTVKEFAVSPAISLRRASLVMQVRPAKEVGDKKLRLLAFETVDRLKPEKDVLITKAVSWLLRSLTVQDKEGVKDYLLNNEKTLPRLAYRETMKVIETGRKTGLKA